jgi:DNA gyrase subunit A
MNQKNLKNKNQDQNQPESLEPKNEVVEITQELESSYLDYAMSVIVSRALPDVRDGLKPVHRRILWAMWDSGLTHLAKYKKSANVVGEVLGRYHPHGDAAVYDAMVRMAQDFSLRYPLIDGQGNWGSIDGDSAAAMRYTEARLSKIAEELLVDIEKDTVDWQPNYDNSRQEPKVLPAKIPNLLINGVSGIAVGMTTSIPPHNLGEVIDAILHLIKDPKSTSAQLMEFIQGPDFPTGGIIYDRKGIIEAYSTGQGSITCRAKAEIVERKAGQFNIVISEIPYMVNKSELIQKIAQLVADKKIEGIKDLRDESDKNGLSIVIELKNDVSAQKILNQLYKHTDLQKDFHMNLVALVNGIQPQLLSLKECLEQYLLHRQEVVRRRTEFDLAQAKKRAHILEGLSKALDHIDAVISTIKKSKDKQDAHKNLVSKFKFSDAQAEAILEMKLQTLASLERKKVEDELKEKKIFIKECELILSSPKKILEVIEKELKEIKEKYNDPRRTQVVAGKLGEFKEEDLISQEEVIITLSSSGYIKRVNPSVFKTQGRGGKGMIGSEVGEEDFLTHLISAKTHDNILFFTDSGKVFQTKVYEIPQGSRTSKGKIIHNFLDIPPSENVNTILAYDPKSSDAKFLIMATANGIVKKTPLDNFSNVRRTGIIAITLKGNDRLKWVKTSSGNDQIILVTALGQSIRFKEPQLRPMGRSASGVGGIRLKKGDLVVGMDIIKEKSNDRLLIVTQNGFAKQTPLKEYKVQSRGGTGIKTAKITQKSGPVVMCKSVSDKESEVIVLSAKGQIIRTPLLDIRTSSRATSGVRLMRLKEGDKIAAIVCL